MTELHTFTPDWISPPGETIGDMLEEQGLNPEALADDLNIELEELSQLLQGEAPLTQQLASGLARRLGFSADFWLRREAQYQEARQRQNARQTLEQMPFTWMVKQGWVAASKTMDARISALLNFFGVSSEGEWIEGWNHRSLAFRSSNTIKKQHGAVAVWVRRAQLDAERITCEPYDEARLRASLKSLRDLTTEPEPSRFVPQLQQICARAGVAVVFVPAPTGCPAHGVTQWLSEEKAMIALSLRFQKNDQLWFSFFHEICHLLNHRDHQLFIEGIEGLDSQLEKEADQFAQDILIPSKHIRILRLMKKEEEVKMFAQKIGTSPGIVVGRLQCMQIIGYNQMNDLVTRYDWSKFNSAGWSSQS